MPWRKLSGGESLGQVRRARLYADEDIEDEVVAALRLAGVNVKYAREEGHRGRPDSFHAAEAFRQKRFLLTKNGRDFLPDSKLPWHRTFGVIAVDGDLGQGRDDYALTMHHLITMFVPFGERFEKMKIHLTAATALLHYIGHDGKIYVERYRFDGPDTYAWEDPS